MVHFVAECPVRGMNPSTVPSPDAYAKANDSRVTLYQISRTLYTAYNLVQSTMRAWACPTLFINVHHP